MTLKELRDMIRWEAQIEGSDTLIGPINKIINEVLRELTALNQYPEMLVMQQSIASGGTDDYTFTLPSDCQHLLDRVFFSETLSDGFPMARRLLKSKNFLGQTEGFPNRYFRVGNDVQVWPRTGTITASSGIWIDYYKYPTTLSSDSDQFPIPLIEPTVRLEVAARISRHGNSKDAANLMADAQVAFSRSKGVVQ